MGVTEALAPSFETWHIQVPAIQDLITDSDLVAYQQHLQLWAGYARTYSFVRALRGLDSYWRQFEDGIPLDRDANLAVDLATGTGMSSLAVLTACPKATVLGVDLSAEMLHEQQLNCLRWPPEYVQRLILVRANLEREPLDFIPDNKADLVTMNFGLMFMNRAGHVKVLSEAHRILRLGGRFHFTTLHEGLGSSGDRVTLGTVSGAFKEEQGDDDPRSVELFDTNGPYYRGFGQMAQAGLICMPREDDLSGLLGNRGALGASGLEFSQVEKIPLTAGNLGVVGAEWRCIK